MKRSFYEKKKFFILLLIFITNIAFAQEHPIDEFEQQCMEKDYSTAGMVNCTYAARQKWDEDLNKYYKLLQKKLNPEQKIKLRDAQRAWIKFRDAEFENINSFYGELDGTMWFNISATDRMVIVKQRALDLKVYYNMFILANEGSVDD